MNSVGTGFYVGLFVIGSCKGTTQKIIWVASSKKLSLGRI